MPVKNGDRVVVKITGSLEDGTVFESPDFHEEPMEILVGDGQHIKAIEDALIDMEVGDEKDITVEPLEGYGDPRPELIKELPRNELPDDDKIVPGVILLINLPNGMLLPVTIVSITEEVAVVDLNHPLAGKVLLFKIKVIKIMSAA